MQNLDPVKAVRLAVNQTTVPERQGKGRKGYGRLAAVRLLVYAQLRGIHKDETLEKHLRMNPKIAKGLGLEGVPDRTTIGRWKEKHVQVVEKAFEKLGGSWGRWCPASF